MITHPLSTIHQHPLAAVTTRPPLPVEPAPGSVSDRGSETASIPGVRSLPRLRRSIELEGAPVTSEAKPTVESPPVTDKTQASEDLLIRWNEQARNAENTQYLISALEEVRQSVTADSSLDVGALLETKEVCVHSLSTFGQAYKFAPSEQVPVAWFLRENNLHVPTDLKQLTNLIDVSGTPLPEPAKRGNHWGLLSQPATLDGEQRAKLRTLATAEMAKLSPGDGMFNFFHEKHGASVQGKSAAEVLESMIESPEVQTLGQTLGEAFNGLPMSTSAAEWGMTAMVLELDPQAGSKRGIVAGYDLYQSSNWGIPPSVVVERLAQHLVEQCKVSAQMAPAAARLLLAGSAPAFIVADMPVNLVVGSATFATLSTVVEAQEFWAQGIATHTDFQTFMTLANHRPVSDAEAAVEAKAQSHALIEWGIAQGKLSRKDDEAYTSAEVAGLRDAFNEELTMMKNAHEQLSATLPRRKEVALEELKKKYGTHDPFDVKNIRITNIDGSESEYYSLLDIYMAGKMDRIPRGERFDFQVGNRYFRVDRLPDIAQQFSSQFDSYFQNLKEGVVTTVKHQLSQLPLEDRQTITSGKVEFFSLRKASIAQAEGKESQDEAKAAKARFGLLMRVLTKIDKDGSDRDYKNLRHVYYEIFPLQGTIRRRDDLPKFPPNPPPRVANPQTYATHQAKGVDVAVDYEAYERGTPPQPGKVSHGLLTEQVNAPYMAEPSHMQDTQAAAFSHPRFGTIARVMVDYLLHDREAMKADAKGVAEVEKEEASIKAGHDFVTGLIPLKNAIENAVKGNTGAAIKDFALDIFGFVIPVGKGLGQAGKALGSLGEKLGARAFKASDVVLRAGVSGLNPVDGLGDLTFGLARGGKTVLQKNYRELKEILQGQTFNFGATGRKTGVIAGGGNLSNVGVDASRRLPDFSTHSLPNSMLEGRTIKGDGTYQVGERHYVRYTDGTDVSKVFEISRVYKVDGGHIRVIDPASKKTVAFLEPAGGGEWRLNSMLGGVRPDAVRPGNTGIGSIRPPARKRPAGQGSSSGQGSSTAGGPVGVPPPFKRPKVLEAFPGEKAVLDPPVKGQNVFYKYNTKNRHSNFVAEHAFLPSATDLKGNPLPRGQGRHYFTDLAPEDRPTAEISEIIFGRNKHGNQLNKMTNYFEVNTTGLQLVKSTNHPHIFYVDTKFSIPLRYRTSPGSALTDRIISRGETLYVPSNKA